MNDRAALSLHNVTYSHEKGKALNETSLEIHKAKTTVILGPNGAGKSILLKLCHGLLLPSSGIIITQNNYDNCAMVFPKPTLLRRTVLQNITYILELMGVKEAEQASIAENALKEFSMDKYKNHPARQLSSGEKQRLSLIRALLLKPNILYLDEPTANLDPQATRILEDMILKSHENKMTILMATHDLMQAKRLAEYIIFIENGTIIETSKADDFFNNPSTEKAKNFIEGRL
ncbi:MAG: ATP-binding cassette domain-containing protein [Kordiimonadaceae bacterium]|jgi:tungstate transport system ATP-binding protein|nr:ATP-binding cassette domain-containing protein [Kordiimonadaceae bacterium]MBT6031980.1 ATP-binding cassette domain-containing protein [Kordiimonadaceae bacterium]